MRETQRRSGEKIWLWERQMPNLVFQNHLSGLPNRSLIQKIGIRKTPSRNATTAAGNANHDRSCIAFNPHRTQRLPINVFNSASVFFNSDSAFSRRPCRASKASCVAVLSSRIRGDLQNSSSGSIVLPQSRISETSLSAFE